MATRRLRDRVRGMPAESSPEWLPDGWTVEVRNTRHGKYKYYISTLSGCTFQSKEEVLHHLSVVKNDSSTSGITSCSDESKNQLVDAMKESPEWLPSGWILEIKTRRSGKRAGKTYKCYFEPLSGNRFYSKSEVLRFHSSAKIHDQTSEEKKHLNRNSTDNVIAHIEYSPDGLPHGWIKETKFREGNGGLRRNSYYTDPINGYVFNSLKDVVRYVETGHVSKHARKPKISVRKVYSCNDDFPSSGSAKKLKSQPTAMKFRITEEILDSNGQLSETRTFPNRLLLSPSSQEDVEVKAEGEETPQSATLSPPCPVNPRERTPKNKRIPKTNCTRKSNTKPTKKLKEKADMESEERIKQEEVTEKPSDPSDQTMMDTQPDGKELAKHTENEEIQGGESKDEGEAPLEVQNMTEKLPMVSNETSKNLLEDEMKLLVPNQKASAEKDDFLDPPSRSLSELEKEVELPVMSGQPSTSDLAKPKHGRSRKTKAMKAISTPRRLSKRLDCIENDPVIDVDMGGEHIHEPQSKDTIDVPQRQNNMEDRATNTMEDMAMTTMDWPEFPASSPFGDSWPDPCIEFAFKTLTGDLPVLDDAITIQEYFNQQLFSVECSSPDVFAPLSNDRTETAPAPDEVEVKLSGEQDIMQERCQSGVMEKK